MLASNYHHNYNDVQVIMTNYIVTASKYAWIIAIALAYEQMYAHIYDYMDIFTIMS